LSDSNVVALPSEYSLLYKYVIRAQIQPVSTWATKYTSFY